MIYFARATEDGPIKIGFTGNLVARKRQLEAHYGRPLTVIATMEGDRRRERQIHGMFAHLRFGHTEQFRPDRDLMEFIGAPVLVDLNPDAVEPMILPEPKTLSVKLPMDVIESARIVSAYTGEPMSDILAAILRPALAKMERDEVARRSKGAKPR